MSAIKKPVEPLLGDPMAFAMMADVVGVICGELVPDGRKIVDAMARVLQAAKAERLQRVQPTLESLPFSLAVAKEAVDRCFDAAAMYWVAALTVPGSPPAFTGRLD
jgi:hypothetical protein